LREWIERLKKIKPTSVQIYTVDRSYPAKELEPATKDELNWIKNQVEAAGIAARVFG